MGTSAHTVKAFDQDLDQLRASIAQMGGLDEAAISESMRALMQSDTDAANSVIEGDKKIDALEAEVERNAVQLIALSAPMAYDLREEIGRAHAPSLITIALHVSSIMIAFNH